MKWLVSLCLLFSITGYAQKRDTVLKYFDAALHFTTKKEAVYFGAAIRQETGWFVFALYPDTSYVITAYYKDKALTVKDGPYALYYAKNNPAAIGMYRDNDRTGVWRTWYQNGQLKDSGFLYYNIPGGLWKNWYANGQLKNECVFKTDAAMQERSTFQAMTLLTKNAGVYDGLFHSWYENGNLEASGTFTNDTMTGVWHWYHQNGTQSTIEEYKKGKVVSLDCFDTSGAASGTMCSLSKPALLRQYGDYHVYIQQNLLWPKEALKKGLEGDVHVTFRVTKEGRLEDLIIETAEPVFKKAVDALFATMTDWIPAVSHNRVIDTDEELTIPFYKKQEPQVSEPEE